MAEPAGSGRSGTDVPVAQPQDTVAVKHHLANARYKVGAANTAPLVWIPAERLSDPLRGGTDEDSACPGLIAS